jgi:hypothetical protein
VSTAGYVNPVVVFGWAIAGEKLNAVLDSLMVSGLRSFDHYRQGIVAAESRHTRQTAGAVSRHGSRRLIRPCYALVI